jgi:hypothetical protein
VLDELELSREGLEPRFLLHTMDEPRVEANCITSSHQAGRLTTTVLLPAGAKIKTIGGEGREFEVNGRNFPLKRKLIDAYTCGAWRAEITASDGGTGENTSRSRKFLTLLVPADINAPREPDATVAESLAGWTVRQGDLAVALVRPGRQIVVSTPRAIHVELAG